MQIRISRLFLLSCGDGDGDGDGGMVVVMVMVMAMVMVMVMVIHLVMMIGFVPYKFKISFPVGSILLVQALDWALVGPLFLNFCRPLFFPPSLKRSACMQLGTATGGPWLAHRVRYTVVTRPSLHGSCRIFFNCVTNCYSGFP